MHAGFTALRRVKSVLANIERCISPASPGRLSSSAWIFAISERATSVFSVTAWMSEAPRDALNQGISGSVVYSSVREPLDACAVGLRRVLQDPEGRLAVAGVVRALLEIVAVVVQVVEHRAPGDLSCHASGWATIARPSSACAIS